MAIPNPFAGADLDRRSSQPTWGLGDFFVGWALAYFAAAIFGVLVLAVAGYLDHPKDAPLALTLIANIPLWAGFILVPVWAAATKGNGWRRDFHASITWLDVPLGIAVGLFAQIIVVPVISWPILQLSGKTAEELAKPAQELADKAHGAGGAIVFLLIVGLFAPLAEELFFRGLLFRSIEKRAGQWWALGISSVVFGATHFEPLQFAALSVAGAMFGYLVIRTGRLGPAVIAHMAFNTTTVVALLWIN